MHIYGGKNTCAGFAEVTLTDREETLSLTSPQHLEGQLRGFPQQQKYTLRWILEQGNIPGTRMDICQSSLFSRLWMLKQVHVWTVQPALSEPPAQRPAFGYFLVFQRPPWSGAVVNHPETLHASFSPID